MKKDKRSGSYNTDYYRKFTESSVTSAKEVIPLILNYFTPRSVADIGCGVGAWLSVWEKNGITDILGVDGDHINKEELLIRKENFLAADLEKKLTISKKFDLVMSLEVAEHIKAEHAKDFIDSLCNLGDIVLFSAAIPNQGGTLHFNEQFPSYWISQFAQFGFSPYDVLREKIWDNSNVNAYYRQNLLFFINDTVKDKFSSITKEPRTVLPLVHPDYLEEKQYEIDIYRRALKTPFHAGWFFIKKYGKKFLSLITGKKSK